MNKLKRMQRMYVLSISLTIALAAPLWAAESSAVAPTLNQSDRVLDIYKSESCSCCKEWVSYIDSHGFQTVLYHPADLTSIKDQYGIAPAYQSCHTAVSKQGYVFEGHVPAWAITRFLANPPKGAKGLAVPGMPVGSAGMEMGDTFTPFDVLLLKNDGTSETYAHIATIDKSR